MLLKKKLQELEKILKDLQPGVIAVSGGIDSTVLGKIITLNKLNFTGLFFYGSHLTEFERKWTRDILKEMNFKFKELSVDILKIKEVKNNSKKRCYFCKKYLFSKVKKCFPKKNIIEGSHLDDSKKFRPGSIALKELNIISPYKIARLTKKDIKDLASLLGINVDKFPSRPCLLTRFPYNTKITNNMLSKIAKGEDFLLKRGIRNFRIRVKDGNFLLHVSIKEKEDFKKYKKEVLTYLNSCNISNVHIDFLEDLSGFFDQQRGEI